MKIDHLVINVNQEYQLNNNIIDEIRRSGFPYEPKWGKGTKGFKATNLWIAHSDRTSNQQLMQANAWTVPQ